MRRFQPNDRGIITAVKPQIRSSVQINPYRTSNPSIPKIDRLLAGEKPKICITRKHGGIGDVLMTTPTIKAISTKYEIKLTYGTNFDYLDGALQKVLLHNPYIDKLLPWDQCNPADYDAFIDLTCPCVAHEKPHAPPINRVDLFARHARIQLIDTDLDYFITEEENEWAEDYLYESGLHGKTLLLVQPSSSSTARDLPVSILKKCLARIVALRPNICPIVITHDSDNKKSDWNFSKIHQFNNYDVRHIAAIMAHSALVICPDSAILHVAAALRHPTFTIFGPTDPYARVNYHPEAVAYWPAKELQNYPCWYSDPGDGYLCWKRIEQSVIVESVIAMIENSPLPTSRDFVTFGPFGMVNEFYELV